MFSPRWRKVLRDLWSHKTRTVLVILSIAVGVFAVGVIASSEAILSHDLSTTYLATNPAHAVLSGNFDEEIVATVRQMPGILDAEGRGSLTVQLQLPDSGSAGQEGLSKWVDLSLITIWDYEDIRLGQIAYISGGQEPDQRELLMEHSSLAENGMRVGDTILVELSDGKRRQLRITGTVHNLGQPPSRISSVLRGYITPETQEWLGKGQTMKEIHLLVEGDIGHERDIQPIAEDIKKRLEKAGISVSRIRIPPPGEHWADDNIQSLMVILGPLGFLALILSGFLVINTISALLAQQTRQIGIMKAIGARTEQLIEMYFIAVIIFGLLSLLVAVPIGAYASYAFVNFIADLLNFYAIGFRIPPLALALQIAVGLLVPLLAALWPVLSGASLTVREAISGDGGGGGQFGNNFIDRFLVGQRSSPWPNMMQLFSRPLLLSLRNTFRRKARLLLTLSTLVLGGAIFIAVQSVHTSLMATLDETFAYWNYDVEIQFSRPYNIDLLAEEARKVPGVVAAESWGRQNATRIRDDDSESEDIRILAPPANSKLINPNLLAGRWLLAEDENALVLNSQILDEEADINVGDHITLDLDGRESTWQVVGIAQSTLGRPTAYANYDYFSRQIGAVGRARSLHLVTEQHDSAYQLQIADTLSKHFNSKGLNVASTRTMTTNRQNLDNQFGILVNILTIMAILIAIVGGLGLTGTMSINVLERSREIGVMRAIGASDSSVLTIFLVEGLLIGFLSWLVGGIISYPISRLLSDIVGIAFIDAPLKYTFSTNGAFQWLALVLLLAALSSLWPSWRATRLTVRDVLAYE